MPETDHDAAKTWDERAATWDDQKEAHVYADQAFATLEPVVMEHLGRWKDLRVLDFGAGTGLLTEKLARVCRDVVALDIAPKMIDLLVAKVERADLNNVVAIAGELEGLAQTHAVLNGPFDLIVASSVCSFLPDFPSALVRLSAMLRSGGLFVQWDWHANAAGDWARGFTRDDLRAAYERASIRTISTDIGFVFSFDGNELEVLQGVGQR